MDIDDKYQEMTDADSQGLGTKLYESWHAELDEVMACLPEANVLSHEAFKMLMTTGNTAIKKIVLVTEDSVPVAVIGIRERGGFWEPITKWMVPGVIFPAKEGVLGQALYALRHEISIAWWRMPGPPPDIPGMNNVTSEPTHGMSCADDFEAYWKRSSLFKDIRNKRNRCKAFQFKINEPGATEWTIRNWEKKWRTAEMNENPDLQDRLMMAEYLQRNNSYYTFQLYDGAEPVAGATMLIHDNEAVAQYNYRNPEYNRYGVMMHLIDRIFFWVKEKGYAKIDIGGSFDYKEKWAPENGCKWEFEIRPRRNILVRLSRRIRDRIEHH